MAIPCVFVMPVYNEEECIAQVCSDWLDVVAALPGSRIIVVDDGSRDRTGAILDEMARAHQELSVARQPNGGHGSAVLHGYRLALDQDPLWIFQVDSDNQFRPEEFFRLWEAAAAGGDFFLGYRAERQDAPHRQWIARGHRELARNLFGAEIRDGNVPFRLMRASFLRVLLEALPPDVFAPNLFLTILAARCGRLIELPVTHLPRKTGAVSIRKWRLAKVVWRCVLELIAFRIKLGGRLASPALAAWKTS